MSYVFISHDLAVVRAMAHRSLVMKDGEIIEQGDADHVCAPQQPYAGALQAAQLLTHCAAAVCKRARKCRSRLLRARCPRMCRKGAKVSNAIGCPRNCLSRVR
jgi:ABC-type dipeptide/oligopeptide/nickel transport system ATPase component